MARRIKARLIMRLLAAGLSQNDLVEGDMAVLRRDYIYIARAWALPPNLHARGALSQHVGNAVLQEVMRYPLRSASLRTKSKWLEGPIDNCNQAIWRQCIPALGSVAADVVPAVQYARKAV